MRQRPYKFYGQWATIDLPKNRQLKNHIDELIAVGLFHDFQAKNKILVLQIFLYELAVKRLVYNC